MKRNYTRNQLPKKRIVINIITTNFKLLPKNVIDIIIDYTNKSDLMSLIGTCKLIYYTFLKHKMYFNFSFKNNLSTYIQYLINENNIPFNYENTVSELTYLENIIKKEQNKIECLQALFNKKEEWNEWLNQTFKIGGLCPLILSLDSNLSLQQRQLVYEKLFNQIIFLEMSIDRADYQYVYKAIVKIKVIEEKDKYILLRHFGYDDEGCNPNFTISYLEVNNNNEDINFCWDYDNEKYFYRDSRICDELVVKEIKEKLGLSFVAVEELGKLLVLALPWKWASNSVYLKTEEQDE
ncbi:hypothetical protein ABK040_011867 [Willaertia magna]